MSLQQSQLFYWDGTKWVYAVTHSGVNALRAVHILEKMGNPKKMGCTLTNFPKDWTSSVAADQKGLLTDIFQDYQQVLVREGETRQILFVGRIYKIEKNYELAMGGNVIKLEAYDALAELRDFLSKGLTPSGNYGGAAYNYRNFDLQQSAGRRSEVIELMIKDSIGEGNSSFLSASTSNLNSTDKSSVGDAGSRFRFEPSGAQVTTKTLVQPQLTGATTVLEEIAALSTEDPHTSVKADKSHGFNYYSDPNFTIPHPASGNWTHNPPAMLNYYKRGTRPTTGPASYGLTVRFGVDKKTITSGTDYKLDKTENLSATPRTVAAVYNTDGSVDTINDGAKYRKATKLIIPGYEFSKPSQELYTHAVMTYSTSGEKGQAKVLQTQEIELIYISDITGFQNSSSNPFYLGKDLYNHVARDNSTKIPPAQLQWNNNGTWTNTNGHVHMATATSSSAVNSNGGDSVADYHAIIVGIARQSVPAWNAQLAAMKAYTGTSGSPSASQINFRLRLWNGTAYAVPTGGSPIDGFTASPTCTFDATTASLGKGRARTAFGLLRPKRLEVSTTTGIETIRTRLLTALYRTNMDLRRSKVSVIGTPYYALDLRIKTVSSNVYTFESIGTSTIVVDLNGYGVKEGFTIQHFGTDSTFTTPATAVVSGSTYNKYGQILDRTNATSITINMNTGSMSVGEHVRIFIPLRAGDMIRVENPQESIAGNHFITQVDYVESGGNMQTTLNTVGRNEDIALTTSVSIDPDALGMSIDKFASGATFSLNADSIPYGQRPFTLKGIVFTRTDRDTISWGGSGRIDIAGQHYTISSGSTGNMTTTIPGGATHPQTYYIYWDGDTSETTFQVSTTASYIADSDNVLVATARANNDATLLAEYWIYGKDPDNIITFGTEPTSFIASGAMVAALGRKGTQPFSSNATFVPRSGDTNDSVTIGQLTGNNPVISFADNQTAVLQTGDLDGSGKFNNLAVGTHYVYFSLTGITPSSGVYGSSGSPVPLYTTTSYTSVNTDDNGLLAILGVSSDTDQEIAIQTFGSKIGNINADNISANSITATAIKTGSLDSKLITLTGSDGKIRTGANVNSGSGNESGIIFSSSGIEGYNSDGTRVFFIDPSDGSAKFGSSAVALASVATGGSLANNLVTGLAAVATGGSLANNLVTGLAAVATGGSIANSLVTGFAGAAQSAVTWDHITGTGTNPPVAGATVGATSSQVTIINSNTSNIATNVTNIGNKFNTSDYLANRDINDISIIDPRLLGQGTLSATTVMAGQMAVGGHAEIFAGTLDAVASTTEIAIGTINVGAGVDAPSASEIANGQLITVDGVPSAGVMPGMYLELVEGSTREIMRVIGEGAVGVTSSGGAILVRRGQAGTAIRQTNWPNNTVCNNPLRQTAVFTQTGSPTVDFEAKHIGGIISYTTASSEGSTIQTMIITGVTSTTQVSVIRGSQLDEPLKNVTSNVIFTVVHLAGARVEMSPAGIKGFNSSDAAQFEIRASDGKAIFGAGKVELGTGGMTIGSGGGADSFLKWEAPSLGDAYIYRKQVVNGWPTGTMIFNVPQGISFWGYVDVDEIHFQSKSGAYTEFATLEAPNDYSASGSSNTARYVMTLPTAGPTAASQSLQTSGSSPFSQLVWATSSGGGGGVTSIVAGSNISINQSTGAVTITASDSNSWRGIDDTPQNGQTGESISSNWAFDHAANATAHHPVGEISSNGVLGQYKGIYSYSNAVIEAAPWYMSGSQIGNTQGTGSPVIKGDSIVSFATIKLAKTEYSGDDAVLDSSGYIRYVASSERYKENIENLTIDTSKVYNLTARSFRFKDRTEQIPNSDNTAKVDQLLVGENSFGYIAEEVNLILPELVRLDSEDRPNTVNYKLLAVLLLEELKKLKARVDTLEAG